MRNSRIIASLCAFSGFLLVVIARGWSGLDQIPSDPGYDYLGERIQSGFSVIEVRPYLYADQSLLASTASLIPLGARAIFLTLASHAIWAGCALVVFAMLHRRAVGGVASFVGGLLLVTTPWAAQSAIGNYGNVRWPILVAATVVISAEVAGKKPRGLPIALAATAAALSNPLHPLLLAPLLIGATCLAPERRKTLAVVSTPLLFGLGVNLVTATASGHSEKITSFWDGAGLFWVSGQVLPIAVSVVGLAFSVRHFGAWSERQLFAGNLFVMAILIAVASYQLGGIADRYYVAPASLAAIGTLVWLSDLRTRAVVIANVVAVLLSMVLIVPTIRWFFVFPYLDSATGWSTQVRTARMNCDTGALSSVELVTSNGESRTDPIDCDDL